MNPPGFIRPAAALEIPLPGHSSRISRWFAEPFDSEIGAVGLEISVQDGPQPVRHPAGIFAATSQRKDKSHRQGIAGGSGGYHKAGVHSLETNRQLATDSI